MSSDKRPHSPEEMDSRRKFAAEATDGAVATKTVKCILSFKDSGSVIGRGGVNIKQIREESGSRVNVSDNISQHQDRLLTVSGTQETIYKAFSLICVKLTEATPGAPFTLRLAVPNAQAGAIIGRQGAKIKEIRESSGAQVQVEKEPLPGSTDRLCAVTGTDSSIALAVYLIASVFTVSPTGRERPSPFPYFPGATHPSLFQPPPAMPATMSSAYPPAFPNPYGVGALAAPHSSPYQIPLSAPIRQQAPMQAPYPSFAASAMGVGAGFVGGTTTETITIPNEFIGSIIGRGGSRIQSIRDSTHAMIKISDAGSDPVRVITITGTPEACHLAAFYIQKRLQEEMARASSVPAV